MSGEDLTVAILREIRDEIRMTRADLGSRIDATNQRLEAIDQRVEGIDHRLEVTNQRLEVMETTVGDFASQHLMLTRYTKTIVDRHDKSIDDLRDRVTKLESAR